MLKKSNILVCLDINSSSNIALRYACYKAKKTGFGIDILTVIESSYKRLPFASQAVGRDKRKEAELHLNKLVKEINQETNIIPTITIREGDIASEIVKEAKNNKECAMIILGKSSTSLSDNTVIPAINRKVGNKIKVPIVIVPENIDEKHLKDLL